MQQLLETGEIVRTSSGSEVTVGRYLGGGGQGEVYVAEVDGQNYALKWYLQDTATTEQRTALEWLVTLPPPSNRFLWPLQVAVSERRSTFGYVMALRDPEYKGIADLMTRRAEPTFQELATTGMQLADSFLNLHLAGLCYRDISYGNVFFDPNSGDVLICDNDNVAFDGDQAATVKGTPRFMAPEVVRGDAKPSAKTDRFSLAVLLFYMFVIHHPLEGTREAQIRCFDLPAMTKLYGTDPLFIFDPNNDANAPLPQFHRNALEFWPIYPTFLQDMFIRSFTSGLHDPEHGRVRETEWRSAMVRLRDSIIYCGNCGAENFYDRSRLQAGSGVGPTCWSCGQSIIVPPRMRIGREVVMLNHDTRLYPHHLDDARPFDFSTPVAEVQRHPTNPAIWGLKNLSQDVWVATTSEGVSREVQSGASVRISAGTKLRFLAREGEFRA